MQAASSFSFLSVALSFTMRHNSIVFFVNQGWDAEHNAVRGDSGVVPTGRKVAKRSLPSLRIPVSAPQVATPKATIRQSGESSYQ